MKPDSIGTLSELLGIIEDWQIQELFKPVQFNQTWHRCTCAECVKAREKREPLINQLEQLGGLKA